MSTRGVALVKQRETMLKRSYRDSYLTTAEPLRRQPESKMRSRLDLPYPSLQRKVHKKQTQMKETRNSKGHVRKFTPGESIYIMNFGPGLKWLIRTIILVTGPVSYAVALQDGRECRRHIDHLRSRRANSNSMIPVCQREQVDTDTDSTPQNAYKPFGSVLPNRETEVVASIPDALVSSMTPEVIEVERDNVVTQTHDIAVFTHTQTWFTTCY